MLVKDVLEFGGLKDAKLVAGKGGINKKVESITVLEVTEPTDGRWVLKNQLSISALYSIKDNIDAQINIIKEFNESGGSGIVICHIDFWVKKVDQRVIDLCDELKFPLIVAPSENSYIDIIIPINDRLLKTESEKYKYSLDLQSELIELIIENRDIHDIAKYIYNISKSGVAVLDINNTVISSTGISKDEIDGIESFSKYNISQIDENYSNNLSTEFNQSGKKFIIQPVISGSDFYGFIAMEYKDNYVEKLSNPKLIIKYACIAVSLISTKKQRVEKMQDIYFRDFLADLFTWNFESEENAIKRGEAVNWDIRNKNLLILVNINYIHNTKKATPCEDNIGEYIKKNLIPKLKDISREDNVNNLVGYRSDNIIVLLDKNNNGDDVYKRARKISRELLKYSTENLEISLSIGISNKYEQIPDISKAYKQALNAMTIGRQFTGENNVYTFLELGYIPFLREGKLIDQNSKINSYFMDTLIEYDNEHETQLIETLRNLLFSEENTNEVAKKMFIHRNTLLARKKRIIEILNHNPFSMPYKLNYLIILSSEVKKYI
jgi:purine catabolism regulator